MSHVISQELLLMMFLLTFIGNSTLWMNMGVKLVSDHCLLLTKECLQFQCQSLDRSKLVQFNNNWIMRYFLIPKCLRILEYERLKSHYHCLMKMQHSVKTSVLTIVDLKVRPLPFKCELCIIKEIFTDLTLGKIRIRIWVQWVLLHNE